MSPPLAWLGDGKRFMWDGRVYPTREEASMTKDRYQHDNFEVRIVDDESGFLIYTRRPVKETVVGVQ